MSIANEISELLRGGSYLHRIFSSEQQVKALWAVYLNKIDPQISLILSKFGSQLVKLRLLERIESGKYVTWRISDIGKSLIDTIIEYGQSLIYDYQLTSILDDMSQDVPPEEVYYRVGIGFFMGIFWKTTRNLRFLTLVAIYAKARKQQNKEGGRIDERIVPRREIGNYLDYELNTPTSIQNLMKILERLREPSTEEEIEQNKAIIREFANENYKDLDKFMLGLIRIKILETRLIGAQLTEKGLNLLNLARELASIAPEISERRIVRITPSVAMANSLIRKPEDVDLSELASKIVELLEKRELTALEELVLMLKALRPISIVEVLLKIYDRIKGGD